MYLRHMNPNCDGNDCLEPLISPCDFIVKFSANGTRAEASNQFQTKVSVVIWKSPSTQFRCDKAPLRTTSKVSNLSLTK